MISSELLGLNNITQLNHSSTSADPVSQTVVCWLHSHRVCVNLRDEAFGQLHDLWAVVGRLLFHLKAVTQQTQAVTQRDWKHVHEAQQEYFTLLFTLKYFELFRNTL